MIGLPKEIIVYDTEYTAWEGSMERGWSGPNEYKEIVEIGAVRVETEKFTELDCLRILIHPIKNPELSEYFIKLTGITQDELNEKGVDLKSAFENFYNWSQGLPMYSYGDDSEELRSNADLIEFDFSFEDSRFFDIRDTFKMHGIPANEYMSSTIVEAFGEHPEARGHDALNDARIIVDGLILLDKKIHSKNEK